MKECTKCKITKELDCFAKNSRGKDGLQTLCKSCQAENTRKWYAANKEYCRSKRYERYKKNSQRDNSLVKKFLKDNPTKIKEYNLRSKFNLELTQFHQMMEAQKGLCSLCNKDITPKGAAAVDHNHTTGKVRELLCSPCNTALGYFKENPEAMRRGADYIEKHNK